MRKFQKPINRRFSAIVLSFICCAFLFQQGAQAQKKDEKTPPVGATPALKRTTSRHELRRFRYGSSLTLLGAPAGSVTIEAWQRSEVDITADIELLANTEEELALLATVNSFTIDEDANHLRILTTGTHDKAFMRRAAKKFPKALLNLPWKIDYRIRVPAMCDLEIDLGRGPFNLSGVEGSITLKALESDATLVLTGGAVMATIGGGTVKVSVPTRSWRGAGALIQLARGDLIVELPANFSAEINADVLRTGQIENTYAELIPQERTTFTTRAIRGLAGVGGATLAFKVTDGMLRIKSSDK